jgi:hypothetical protein
VVKSRTTRARGSADGHGIDDLIGRTQDFLGNLAFDFLRRPVEGFLRSVLAHATRHAVAAALLGLGAAFLLYAAAEGLIALGTPPFAAHAAAGAGSIGVAWLLLRGGGGSD